MKTSVSRILTLLTPDELVNMAFTEKCMSTQEQLMDCVNGCEILITTLELEKSNLVTQVADLESVYSGVLSTIQEQASMLSTLPYTTSDVTMVSFAFLLKEQVFWMSVRLDVIVQELYDLTDALASCKVHILELSVYIETQH
jgi:hypothetical protein